MYDEFGRTLDGTRAADYNKWCRSKDIEGLAMGVLVALGVLLLFGLFVAGSASAPSKAADVISVTPFTDGRECAAAQSEYIRTAGQTCTFVVQADAATASREAVDRELIRAQLVAAGLLAGAIVASFVPFFGQFLATSLMNAYIAAQSYVVFLLGQLDQAATAEVRANREWVRAFQAVDSAEASMVERCGTEVAGRTRQDFRPCDPGGTSRPLPG